jgi:sugar phosphate isomerase/epimerase
MKNDPDMKIALNAQQLADTHSIPEILDVFESYGVKALELWPANLPGTSRTPEEHERYETKDVDSVSTLIRTRGFQVACVTLGFHAAPLCIAKGGTQRLTEALREAVDAAVKLECQLVNCYTAHVNLALFLEAVRPAAEYAAARGVVITLENEAHDESALPEDIARLVETVNSPGFRTQYDPCNYYHAYVEPFPHAYSVIRQQIGYVHFKGGCHYVNRQGVHQGSTMRHSHRDFIGYVPLSESAFPVEGIIRHLKADGYKGWVTLEPHVPASVVPEFYKQDLAYLRSLL